MKPARLRRLAPTIVLGLGLLLPLAVGALAHDAPPAGPAKAPDNAAMPTMPMADTHGMRMADMNAARGRILFVSKGCVACHSINGVGGHDATPLDAHTMAPAMNPFDFAAKMWRMAPAMIFAQEEALGEQIEFTGGELADIIAFVHDDREQHNLKDSDITPEIRKLMGHAHGAPNAGDTMHGGEGHGHGLVPQPDAGH